MKEKAWFIIKQANDRAIVVSMLFHTQEEAKKFYDKLDRLNGEYSICETIYG